VCIYILCVCTMGLLWLGMKQSFRGVRQGGVMRERKGVYEAKRGGGGGAWRGKKNARTRTHLVR